MKPTSIIFIILSAVLLAVGVVTCFVSANSADSKGIELICDRIDKDGNAITSDELDEYEITTFELNMKDVNVNIIGGSDTSYIEFVNINPAVYDYGISSGKMELDTISPFKFSAFFKIRENGSPFSGLRSYLYLNEYEGKEASVNIYVADGASTEKFTVNLENGNITVKDISVDCSYNLEVSKGDIIFENADSGGTAKAVVNTGNFKYDASSLSKLKFEVNKGNADFICKRQCRLELNCETGSINIAGENMGASIQDEIFPVEQQFETTEDSYGELVPLLPVDVSGSVKNGNITITQSEAE